MSKTRRYEPDTETTLADDIAETFPWEFNCACVFMLVGLVIKLIASAANEG